MLLKTGLAAMTVALFFGLVAAFVALRSGPAEEVAAAQTKAPSSAAGTAPLARTYPPKEPGAPPEPEGSLEVWQAAQPERQAELSRSGTDWPKPTRKQLEEANKPRSYKLPAGAIMGLTIDAIGLKNVPVFTSEDNWALDNGVAHEPGTSLPWSSHEQRNVYLAGHRYGWPGTGSHLIFLHVDKLARGDEILLQSPEGDSYRYRVSETFEVDPGDSWVMGRVRGRDMVTLQTCTPIPTWEKRLIVRADRI